jgi:hypothetical protein
MDAAFSERLLSVVRRFVKITNRHLRHPPRVTRHFVNLVGQGEYVTGRYEILWRQQFWDAPNCRTETGQTTGHGFNHCPWQPLLKRWQDEDVRGIEVLANTVTSGHLTEELDPVLNPEIFDLPLEILSALALSRKDELDVRPSP